MRNKLILKLSKMWRYAEDKFQETEKDSEKWKVLEFQNKKKLTTNELKELNKILNSMGV